MSWLFKEAEHSKLYVKYRPKYAADVYKLVTDKLKESYEQLPEDQKENCSQVNGKWELALDVGCGPGTSTSSLTDYFHETFGVDSSESQIYEAKKAYGNKDPSKVTFICHDSACLSSLVGESSVDLITVASALHWFDRPKFYTECRKVLKPGGLLAAFGPSLQTFEDPRDQQILDEFYTDIRQYAEIGMFHVEDKYARIFVEFKEFFPLAERDDSIVMTLETSLDEYVGYLSSWSPYRKFITLCPNQRDPLVILKDRFREIHPDPSWKVRRSFGVYILFGRNC